MKVLINSSVVLPHRPDARYQGIERLCREFALELLGLGHTVTITAPPDSEYPDGITVIEVAQGGADAENASFGSWKGRLGEFDVIHDFSHLHAPALTVAGLPALNVFWHDPYIAQFMEPGYNIIALSQYGADAFKAMYGQEARHQETIVIDLEKYALPDAILRDFSAAPVQLHSPAKNSPRFRSQTQTIDLKLRFLSLGLMLPLKGHLEAMRLCRKLDVGLDVVGGTMPTDDQTYKGIVERLCDGGQIQYWGDVDDDTKIALMQNAKALIYPQGQLEVHSHKSIEAMACGCPVITYDRGAMKEVIGTGGVVVDTEAEFLNAMENIDCLDINPREWAQKWDIHKVVGDYLPLYEEVANGLRW